MSKSRQTLMGRWPPSVTKANGSTSATGNVYTATSMQIQSSTGHPFRSYDRAKHRKKRKAKYGVGPGQMRDCGGPFLQRNIYPNLGKKSVHAERLYFGVKHEVDLHIGAHFGGYSPSIADMLQPSSNAQLDAWGATGISRASPTNPQSGIGQLLAELRDTPKAWNPDYWKKATRDFKNMNPKKFADRHLEVSFGWLPLIRDIQDFFKVSGQLTKRVTQIERDSGRRIRRRRTILSDSSTTIDAPTSSYGWPAMQSYMYQSPGTKTKITTTTRKVWFSGAFTYYLPPIAHHEWLGDFRHYKAVTNQLFGTSLTPALLWELAPWSWLIDWKVNAGDIVNNWTNFHLNGLVMHYGYVMEQINVTTTYQLRGLRIHGEPKPVDVDDVIINEVKSRRSATPYGFGLNPGSFSGKQLAILLALGIQKL